MKTRRETTKRDVATDGFVARVSIRMEDDLHVLKGWGRTKAEAEAQLRQAAHRIMCAAMDREPSE